MQGLLMYMSRRTHRQEAVPLGKVIRIHALEVNGSLHTVIDVEASGGGIDRLPAAETVEELVTQVNGHPAI